MRCEELRVVVTGAASGLGREFALRLAGLGSSVIAIDIDRPGLDGLARDAAAAGPPLTTLVADVTQEPQVTAALASIGTLNALINNAGIYRDGALVSRDGDRVRRMPLAQWRAVIDTDLTGPFLMAREAAALMLTRRVPAGLIINIASIMRHGNAGQSNYSAAKAGVAALTKVWAEELAPHGIRVATIAPGFIRTPILKGTDPAIVARWLERVPLHRLGEPEEVFAAVKFIIECDFFTGKCLDVDGGLSV